VTKVSPKTLTGHSPSPAESEMLYAIDSVKKCVLPYYCEGNGDLTVMEELNNVPFSIARVFVVRAPSGAIRGQHAHRTCVQFLTCPSGSIEVICDDGEQTMTCLLDRPDMGLLIPPSIWAQQVYKEDGTVLTVLCDRLFEEADYIREYEAFRAFRK